MPRIEPGRRIRGYTGMKMRARRLRKQPLCVDCLAKGKSAWATVPDHIEPLAKGGLDVDENIRCLCADCHDKRTREQFGLRKKLKYDVLTGWPVDE